MRQRYYYNAFALLEAVSTNIERYHVLDIAPQPMLRSGRGRPSSHDGREDWQHHHGPRVNSLDFGITELNVLVE